MRKLASIKIINDIRPIEGRDRIELAIVDGWSVIVKKNEFNIGDKCIYIEIDSVLPEKPEFEFLRSKNFRIKTMKMAGVISQGICFPLSFLPAGEYEVDQDITELMGITQYNATMDVEPVVPKKTKWPRWLMRYKWFRKMVLPTKRERKGFPTFISKTDETRVQNMPFILENKNPWVATEKIDGQSGTFCLVRNKSKIPFVKDKFEFIVCSRNLRIYHPDNSSYWSVARRYELENVLKNMIGSRDWIAIQGECVAPNVQGNKYKVSEPDLYVFNLIYPTGRLPSEMAKRLCEARGLKFVPILDNGFILPDTVEETLKYAHGQSQIGDTLREGVVFRSQDGKKSFKAVDPLFLIHYDE